MCERGNGVVAMAVSCYLGVCDYVHVHEGLRRVTVFLGGWHKMVVKVRVLVLDDGTMWVRKGMMTARTKRETMGQPLRIHFGRTIETPERKVDRREP